MAHSSSFTHERSSSRARCSARRSRPGSCACTPTRLPDSDDVLAKWMALTGDEKRLVGEANMHLPGRQVDPGRVRRDLWRLQMWERERRDSATGAKKR